MAFLDRAALLKKETFKIERVDLANGDFVYVRQMSSKMKDMLENSILKKVKKNGKIDYEQDLSMFRAKVASLCLCDEDGNLLLTLNDAELLSENKPAEMLDKIAETASKLNGISVEAQEEAVKNSEVGQDEDSSSDCAES